MTLPSLYSPSLVIGLGLAQFYIPTVFAGEADGSLDQYPDEESSQAAAETESVSPAEETVESSSEESEATSVIPERSSEDSEATTAVLETSVAASPAPSAASSTVWWTPETATPTQTIAQSSSLAAESTVDTLPSSRIVEGPKSTTSSTASSITTSPTSHASGTCGVAYAQCGGKDYSGVTCCQAGLTCVTVASYWAQCVSQSTLGTESGSGATGTTDAGSSSQQPTLSTSVSSTLVTTQYDTSYVTAFTSDGSTYNTTISSHVISSGYKEVSTVVTVNGAASNFYAQHDGSKDWKSKLLIGGLVGLSLLLTGA
ncbi:DEKNAAC101629 [Brettanomyces naardenensis]|uniref:DEKNAAC101629 n=1 Tax=Brettanomyces naardenensis TaxID=13370 RepID=A0A448YIF8_BRENA|nr:DEKNAAC101629 [Brettanomyces naardenensis]